MKEDNCATIAVTSIDVCHMMNIENEILTVFKHRDNEIAQAKKEIEEKDKQIAEQSKQIAHKDEQIAHKDEQIAVQSEQIAHKDKQIAMLIKILIQGGRSLEDISVMLNISVDDIKKIISE